MNTLATAALWGKRHRDLSQQGLTWHTSSGNEWRRLVGSLRETGLARRATHMVECRPSTPPCCCDTPANDTAITNP